MEVSVQPLKNRNHSSRDMLLGLTVCSVRHLFSVVFRTGLISGAAVYGYSKTLGVWFRLFTGHESGQEVFMKSWGGSRQEVLEISRVGSI